MSNKGAKLNIPIDALIIALGTLASVVLVATSYGAKFDLLVVASAAGLFSLLLSFILHRINRPFLPILLIFIAVAVYTYLDRTAVKSGAKLLYYAIMRPPSLILPFLPVPSEPVIPAGLESAYTTAFLSVEAALFSVVIALVVIKGNSPLPAILAVLPSILLSMVYTDCSPALYALILLMLYIGSVLFGSGIRRDSAARARSKLVFAALLLLGALALSVLSPQNKFVPIPFEQRRSMLGERIGLLQDSMLSLFSKNPKQYGLDSISDRSLNNAKAFSVRSSVSGSFLLRTHSYGLYERNAFAASPEYDGSWRSLYALGSTQYAESASISIQGALMSERLVPYAFTTNDVKVEESFVRAYGDTSYTWTFKPHLRFTPAKSGKDENEYYSFALKSYTMPLGEQKDKLIELMDEEFPVVLDAAPTFSKHIRILAKDDPYQAALSVASAVSSIGKYSLTPGKTPNGRDFVEYFVSENEKGYCVHYAAAAAAFLQALDIPARFTIGYRADVDMAETWQEVPQKSSHAWVEVYIKGVGWVPFECSPGFPENTDYAPFSANEPLTPSPISPITTPRPIPDPNSNETDGPIITRPSPRPTPTPTPGATQPPRPSPTPAANGPGGQGGTGGRGSGGKLGGRLIPPLIIAAVIALWQLVGLVINKLRERRFKQQDPNAAVLCMLRYLKRLERFGIPPEPDAKELGEEAAFSNHSMREKQQDLIERCISTRRTALKNKPIKRFFLRRMIFLL